MDTSATNSNSGPDVIFSDPTNRITNEKETNIEKNIDLNGKIAQFSHHQPGWLFLLVAASCPALRTTKDQPAWLQNVTKIHQEFGSVESEMYISNNTPTTNYSVIENANKDEHNVAEVTGKLSRVNLILIKILRQIYLEKLH